MNKLLNDIIILLALDLKKNNCQRKLNIISESPNLKIIYL